MPRPGETPTGRIAPVTAPGSPAASLLYCDVNARHPMADIRLSGDLAADTVAELGAQLTALIRTGHDRLIVDGHGLTHVSPVCVGVLNRAASGLVPLGGDLVLTGLSGADADRLRTAGLHGAIRLAAAHDVGTAAANETSSPDGASTARY